MKIKHFIGGIVMFAVWTAFILLIVILCWRNPNAANAAESAIVSFNDAEHLVALQDSVVGVCDTVPGYWVHEDTIYNFKIYVPEIEDSVAFDYAYVDSDTADTYPCWVGGTITCRRLAGLTVVEQTRTIPNAERESVYTWERPLPYHVFDPPDSTREAEWKKLNTKWLDKLSKTPEFTTIPGQAIIFYEKVKQ